MMTPHVVRQIILPDGRVHNVVPVPLGQPITAQTAHTLTEMLATSLELEGSGALVDGYRIAGKTGTADIPPYVDTKTVASFVGWGPVDDPQVLIYIRIDEPTSQGGRQYGSITAAPVFGALAPRIFAILGIPPDAVRPTLESGNLIRRPMLTLGVILEAVTNRSAGTYDALPLAHRVITDAVIDSRLSIPGCLFIALPGEKVDGHQFVEDAFTRGAAVALTEKEIPGVAAVDVRGGSFAAESLPSADPHAPLHLCLRVENSLKAMQHIAAVWRERLTDLRVIGITGSVGKSTTKELTANVLAVRFTTLANESNLNNEIGLPLTLLKVTEAHRRVVLEMGFYVPGRYRLPVRDRQTPGGRADDDRAGAPRARRKPRGDRQRQSRTGGGTAGRRDGDPEQ